MPCWLPLQPGVTIRKFRGLRPAGGCFPGRDYEHLAPHRSRKSDVIQTGPRVPPERFQDGFVELLSCRPKALEPPLLGYGRRRPCFWPVQSDGKAELIIIPEETADASSRSAPGLGRLDVATRSA